MSQGGGDVVCTPRKAARVVIELGAGCDVSDDSRTKRIGDLVYQLSIGNRAIFVSVHRLKRVWEASVSEVSELFEREMTLTDIKARGSPFP